MRNTIMPHRSALLAACALLALTGTAHAQSQPTVHIYNWSDYIGENTLEAFQQRTGIRPVYDVFDSNETLEGKQLAGRSGYDVVVPSNHLLARQITAGAFQRLDGSQVPNWVNLGPELVRRLDTDAPVNHYAVAYLSGPHGPGS